MAAISGLQSPNPYAQRTTRGVAPSPSAARSENLLDQVDSLHPSYSPDWMQADHVSTAQTMPLEIYGRKGELQKLPVDAANETPESSRAVADNARHTSSFMVHF